MKTKFAIYSVLLTGLLLLILFNCKKEALKVAPTVTIAEATNITANSATVSSTITADGGTEVLSRGVCWNINGTPTISDSKTTDGKGMGSFTSSLTSLSPGTTYNLKSYATNAIGTAYSSQTYFKTQALLATLTTTDASAISSISVSSGGNITNDGGAEITARGVCWSTAQNPTIADSKTSDATGPGIFTSSITGLTPGTTYYIISYSTNSIGTAYGNQVTAITLAILPTVTTTDLSLVTSNSATSGGNITNDGGAEIAARGVCWSTNQNPTIADSKTSDATGKGVFSSNITGLTPGSTYYFRAYATNSIGTAYGNQVTSTTTPILPTIATTAISKIAAMSAVSGGNVTNDGGAPITARGVCWGLSQTPTTTNSKTTDGTGKGDFTSSIKELASGITYYIRAYATNSIGTAYGEAVAFKTVIPSTSSNIKPTGLIPTTEAEFNLIPTISSIDPASVLALKSGTILPSSFSITIIPPVEDQGTQNSCVGFAMGYGMMSYTFKDVEGEIDYNGQDRLFSPNYIWNQLNNGENKGISYYSAINLLKSQGCCKLTDMSISSSSTDQPSATAKTAASKYKITDYFRLTKSDIENDLMKTYLSKKYPIAVGMDVDDGFQLKDKSQFERQSDGRLVWKAYKDNARYGHAMLICGYDDAIHAYKVLNSWGTIWGEDGFCWIDYDFFKTAVQGSFLSSAREVYIGFVRRPQLSTTDLSGVTSNSAQCGGTISSDSGISPSESKYAVTSRGVCWSKMADPTILDDKTTDGTGIGTFTSSLTGLDADRMYYVKAYAINGQGVSYGTQKSFITSKATSLPTVTTVVVSSITTNSATSGGNVTADGNASVTTRGVCWSTSSTPTTSNTKTTNGTGTGSYTSSITGLSPNTTYYVRAYATNSVNTAYGNQVTFTTAPPDLPTGRITGIVRDASTSASLSSVTITVFMSTTTIATSSSQSDGRYDINIPGNTGYKVVFSKQGYLNAEYQNVNVTVGGNTVLEPVLQIDLTYSGNGNISGTIKNALDGTGIPSVSLKLRSGINVTSGTIIESTTTSSSGTYTFTGVPAGNYTIEASKSNFNTAYFSAICLGGRTVANQDATMSPILITGETRIVLTWGESPSDLDSHLTGPLADGTRFHMYYPYAERNDGSPWPETVTLDVDNITNYGPETTTLLRQINGIYRFSVHDFSNKGLTNSNALSNSGAQVKVYQNSGLVATFNIPPSTGGTLWTVFEMSGSTITTINQMDYESTPLKRGSINAEIQLFRNLPQK